MDMHAPPRVALGGKQRRRLYTATVSAVAMVCLYALFNLSLGYFVDLELQGVNTRAALYRTSLINALERFHHLPHVLAQDTFVMSTANGADAAVLNHRLAAFSDQAGLEAIYLMDIHGQTIAASNHDKPVTFLGQNYAFRPYFKDALAGNLGEFFAIGSTTSRPGYFIAQPVRASSGVVIGVIALKVDLNPLVQSWSDSGERVLVTNGDGVVVLSSHADWLYGTIAPITPQRMAEIRAERQFGREPLDLLSWQQPSIGTVRMDDATYLHQSIPVERLGWSLHLLGDVERARERAWFSVIAAAILISLFMMAAFFLRSVRINNALQASQADRRKLRVANIELERAQAELARTGKLAVLGQLAASVTHELGQPISAMRNYLMAAELDAQTDDDRELLKRLGSIVRRMENIAHQLRFFAQPSEETFEPVDLAKVWKGAYALVAMDLQMAKIELRTDLDFPASTPVPQVMGNRYRLEQVVVNLLKNAISVLKDSPVRVLTVRLYCEDGFAVLSVEDTGPGLGSQSIEQLQEPFHTTKASGEGMGLGLAISAEIIKEHGGQMLATNRDTMGAIFTLKIPQHDSRSPS